MSNDRQSTIAIAHKSSNLTRVLGWALSGASLLNLVQDLALVSIVGKLHAWLDAYSAFVKLVGGWLFGWIRFSWFSISPAELHVLVLTGVFCTGLGRAIARFKSGGVEQMFPRPVNAFELFYGLVFATAYAFLPILLLAALFHDPYGALAASGALAVAALAFGVRVGKFVNADVARYVRHECIGTICVFLLMVVVCASLQAPP